MLPDFLIIGAMKCGTSTLQAQLAAQPQVFMTTPKEPNYFSDDDVYDQGPDWYAALFDQAKPDQLKGEASTHYTKLPTHPKTLERMQGALKAPKLIYMVRNPLDRAVSHYIHAWSMEQVGSDASVALKVLPEIAEYGRYAMQIAPFVAAYGVDQIFLTSLEQIKKDPDAELAKIAQFLDLPDTVSWVHDLPAQNVSSERVRRFPLQSLFIDNPVARVLRRALVPKSVRDKIRRSRTIQDRPTLSQADQDHLIKVYLADRAELAKLFPDHPVLDLCYPFATP